MCQVCEELRAEKANVRPIPVEEAMSNENVFIERLEEKINEILTKYHCLLDPKIILGEDGKIKGIEIKVVLNNHVFINPTEHT